MPEGRGESFEGTPVNVSIHNINSAKALIDSGELEEAKRFLDRTLRLLTNLNNTAK